MSKKIQLTYKSVEQRAERELIGLVDAGHNIIYCSNCGAPLIDIWITNPKINMQIKIQAICGHCGDHSFVREINGQFHYGPAYINKSGNYDENGECFSSLELPITDDEKELIIFKTNKVRKWK